MYDLLSEYCPGGQSKQSSSLSVPFMGLYVPLGHGFSYVDVVPVGQ